MNIKDSASYPNGKPNNARSSHIEIQINMNLNPKTTI